MRYLLIVLLLVAGCAQQSETEPEAADCPTESIAEATERWVLAETSDYVGIDTIYGGGGSVRIVYDYGFGAGYTRFYNRLCNQRGHVIADSLRYRGSFVDYRDYTIQTEVTHYYCQRCAKDVILGTLETDTIWTEDK